MKEQKIYVLKSISSKLNSIGFKNKIRDQSFLHETNVGFSMIHLRFINHEDDFDITISVSIRINQVEEIINNSNNYLKKNEQIKTSTIGCELGNLVYGFQKRYKIESNSNLDKVIEEMIDFIKKNAFPFFEKFGELENVFEIALKDDQYSWMLFPFHYHRAQVAIVLAKILRRNDLDEIFEEKRLFLETRNEFGLDLFIKLFNKIENVSFD